MNVILTFVIARNFGEAGYPRLKWLGLAPLQMKKSKKMSFTKLEELAAKVGPVYGLLSMLLVKCGVKLSEMSLRVI